MRACECDVGQVTLAYGAGHRVEIRAGVSRTDTSLHTLHECYRSSGTRAVFDVVRRAGITTTRVFMKENLIGADDLVATFAQQRQVLLKHTADLLCADGTPVRQPGAEVEAKLSAILVSSLEELKVAEEELLERTEALADLRDDLEQRVRCAHQLFDLSPACLVVTDIYGNITEANRACQLLLKRDFSLLERQPFARFIPAEERRAFREGLARLAMAEGVNDWRLSLVRPTAGPVAISASVHVVKSAGTAHHTKLFWSIRVLEPTETTADA
jgi:PAS domain-containing protein